MRNASVPIVGDVPSREPGLGFEQYAKAIEQAICYGEPAQFTLAIYGQWGTGKSTLLLAIEQRLSRQTGRDVIPVFFDAWRYEGAPNIVVPLVHHIVDAVRGSSHTKIRASIGRVLDGIVKSLEADFLWGAFRIRGKQAEGVAGDGGAFVKATRELEELSRHLVQDNARIVLLIDDLDRCRPERVVDVVEAIKVILNVPGIVSVIAMDYRRLISALDARYKETQTNAYSFMEKIVQAEFHLPAFRLEKTYWTDLKLERAKDPELMAVPGIDDLLHGIATDALESNPRQFKRYLNTLLLYRRIVQQQAAGPSGDGAVALGEIEKLAAVIGFQLGYPASFQAWQQRVNLHQGTGKIIALLADPEAAPDGRRVPDPPRGISANHYVEKYLKRRLDPADFKAAQIVTNWVEKRDIDNVGPTTLLRGRVRVKVSWSAVGADVDLSALMLNRDGSIPDYEYFVYYRTRRSHDRAVSHRGDSGVGGMFEEIDVNLDTVDSSIDAIVFALSIYQSADQPAAKGLSALGPIFVAVVDGNTDDSTGQSLYSYPLGDSFTDRHTGATIARLERVGAADWNFSQTTQAYETGLVGIGRDYGVELA